ncbi:methionine aminopeptidase 1 [bacterium BMS3Abin07]|nr:methionine aminopeptidase 1 [bacterium BMS3Abin07]GBE33366.1 methionine aminopeptidase 1 [bacterium BMS3Bbin05]HDL20452.1 type I methionyl aminopeptidase [Nitrospirota bacterium]HDO21917.1 type I methionyl aminopeptidase [Nitrospirota bacterium]HDZ87993.1 type I methionyl aminopeptidase [Nitrospirota bacterium]
MIITNESDKKNMAYACRIVAETLQSLKGIVRPGVTTKELELYAEELIRSKGGIPVFKGYKGYPSGICTSVNSQVVHGIPSACVYLKDGDIISIDLGVKYKGFIGDAALTYPVGIISDEAESLLKVTEKSLYLGMEKATDGNRVSDISSAVQKYVESNGFSVVRAFVGHGLGKNLHEEPQIPNYVVGKPDYLLKRGLAIAVEPMVNAGGYEVSILGDGWTAVTVDGSLSAHFEHTLLVGENGPEVLTKL